jgi:hypothetical protein
VTGVQTCALPIFHLPLKAYIVNDDWDAPPLKFVVALAPDTEPELSVKLAQGCTDLLKDLPPRYPAWAVVAQHLELISFGDSGIG